MTVTRENCEAFLMHIIAQILRADVTTVSALLANASLKKYLCQALCIWGNYVACAQRTVTEAARTIGMTHEEMVSDFVNHIFGRGQKSDEKPYPRLTELLRVAHEDGAHAVIRYMMRVGRNRALDLERRYQTRQERSGHIYGFTQDDEYGVIDPGEACDKGTLDFEGDIVRNQALRNFFSTMGTDFVRDVVILTDALGIRRNIVAQLFFTGRQTELVVAICQRLNKWLDGDYSACLTGLMEKAKAYRLPARFHQDYDALLAWLYRQSSSACREKLARRLEACGY